MHVQTDDETWSLRPAVQILFIFQANAQAKCRPTSLKCARACERGVSEGRIGELLFEILPFFFTSRRSASSFTPTLKGARARADTDSRGKEKGPGAATAPNDETPIKASGNHI